MKKQSRWMRIFSCFLHQRMKRSCYSKFLIETVCLPQFGDDLGERMKNAIGIVRTRMGYEKVILIGTDIPQIHPETLKNAFDNLGEKIL